MKRIKYSLISALITWIIFISCGSEQNGSTLEAPVFYERLEATSDEIILDVRTPEEFAGGSIANAVNMDFRSINFTSGMNKLDKNKTYFVYCLSGGRSGEAANLMRNSGFKEVYDMKGGLKAWLGNKFPVVVVAPDSTAN
jgi:thioredoxin 1